MIKVTPPKLDKVRQEVATEIKRRVDAAGAMVYLVGTEVATAAMRLTPVDTGYLRSSRFVEHPSYSATRTSLRVGFYATYARFVHDRNRKYRLGQSHFLDLAVARFDRSRLPGLYAQCLAGNLKAESLPSIHPTGALVGPEVHPRRRRATAKRLRRQAKIDRLRGVGK